MNGRTIFSTELRVALAPATAYRELLLLQTTGSWLAACARPALTALLIGTLIAMTSTGRVTLGVVSTVAVCWSFAPAVQAAAAAIIIASCPQRHVTMPRALDLLFAGHLPWSLWLLAMAAWVTSATAPFAFMGSLALSMLVPVVWTVRIVFAFCRTVLGATGGGALRRTFVHQAIVWMVALAYATFAGGLWPRVLGVVGR